MASRLQLHSLLQSLTERVYFQPPGPELMLYPCILYIRDGSDADYADDKIYRYLKRYQVTVVSRDPDTDLPDKLEELKYCSFDRFFVADNLNHYVFTLFF